MDLQNVGQPQGGILFGHKKDRSTGMCHIIWEPGGPCAQWKRPEQKDLPGAT